MKRNYFLVGLVMLVFFVISFLTNILGPLIPDIISSFNLSLTMVALLPFAFFIAYGVMSIPSGMLLERYREKRVMTAAFISAFIGALLFALHPVYSVALISLFLLGAGMATLQVAINPLLRAAGGEEHFAFNSVLAQLIFGLASFLSPFVYSHMVRTLADPAAAAGGGFTGVLARLVPRELPWSSLYWVIAAVTLIMVLVMLASRFPEVTRKEDERAGAWATHVHLFKQKTVILFFIGIFAYVGTEQGIANWMSKFLQTYHGLDPQTVGASSVAWFWGLMTAGCFLGLLLLKLFDSRAVLVGFTVAAMVLLTAALFGPVSLARYAFPLLGFGLSVMWSIIFSLALNSVSEHHGSFSGILCTGIAGGALLPLVIGRLGDWFGLRIGMTFLYITLAYILSVGLWAKPLIQNETVAQSREKKHADHRS
ncbi:MAG TPA: MFS transporter [bacterium]|nr:MFS transporter [bacterium]HPR87937.1 MFS transporter [bacterium]